MDIIDKRKSIRTEIAQLRDSIAPAQRTMLSRRIISNLYGWMQKQKSSGQKVAFDAVMIYLSMRSEVETWEFGQVLFKEKCKVIAPIVDIKSRGIMTKRIENLDNDLIKHKYGMFEPKDSCPDYSPEKIQLILVPGLAFDRNGYRIGYGKGFYDRFLPSCPNAITVGIAFQLQIVNDTYPQPWDIPVQHVFTENGLLLKN